MGNKCNTVAVVYNLWQYSVICDIKQGQVSRQSMDMRYAISLYLLLFWIPILCHRKMNAWSINNLWDHWIICLLSRHPSVSHSHVTLTWKCLQQCNVVLYQSLPFLYTWQVCGKVWAEVVPSKMSVSSFIDSYMSDICLKTSLKY